MGTQQVENPMAEYLLKLQLIIRNSEFKNKEEANKYETAASKMNGDAYVRAITKTDIFESYNYDRKRVYQLLIENGITDQRAMLLLDNMYMIPQNLKDILLSERRKEYILTYRESNKYYINLSGQPYISETNGDEIVYIPDEFYEKYKNDPGILRSQPIHELSSKFQDLFMNSEYYQSTLNNHPKAPYLKYIGGNKIDIHVSRKARDGDIMKINTNRLSTYHQMFGNVSVDSSIIHAFSNIYKKTRDYIYQTLRGNFSDIYPNYNSLIRFLTIYMSIGAALNEFQRKSAKLIYMNNTTANNMFMLYGLPSVIMEGTPMIEFLKKFRLLLMDKGTNVVYRVKDLIGYESTDIYSLIMVKQQVFENGVPVYTTDSKTGEMIPKQNVVFRRLGTADDNTSYFKFRESKKEYTVEEISSGDPRWWNTTEVDQMLEDMNYTLSNSKYIQLSTHMSMTDIWWQCVIFLRGILDNKIEAMTTLIDVNRDINGSATMTLYDAILSLIIMMDWQMVDFQGKSFNGNMYIPKDGKSKCIDMLFDGMDGYSFKPFIEGNPFKIASFNFEIREKDYAKYATLKTYEYLEPNTFMGMLDHVLDMSNNNIGETLMTDVRNIYEYIKQKVLSARTISEFRQASDAYSFLFLVDPIRDWYDTQNMSTDEILCNKYDITYNELSQLKQFFKSPASVELDSYGNPKQVAPDIVINYEGNKYNIYLYTILNENVYDLDPIYHDTGFIALLKANIMALDIDMSIRQSSMSLIIKENYKRIICDKIDIDLGNSANGPTTFESLLMIENPKLYEYLSQQKADKNSDILMIMRSIIKGLETYTNSSLAALESTVLGPNQYINILKEVISYFKSYMVEFTKEEFIYIFGGILDNGGNSDLLKLMDEISHGKYIITPMNSLTLYDVSHSTVGYNFEDRNGTMYDDCIIRLKAAYKKIKEFGYDIWHDDGVRITKQPSIAINDNDDIVANIVKSPEGYKIIINMNNVIKPKSEEFYGNVY